MTKEELKARLQAGEPLDGLFHWSIGQECVIFKADTFRAGADILYIPDVALNDLQLGNPVSGEEIKDILWCCYSGNDFIDECGGDQELAERLFHYCDWQHPSSVLPEIYDEDDDGGDGKPGTDTCKGEELKLPRNLRPWTVRLCETVYDITLNAQHMCDYREIEVEDSRDLFASILQWAIEFEREHPGPWDEEDHGIGLRGRNLLLVLRG